MTLKELLDKGHRQFTHPNLNGVLVNKDTLFESGFDRIYLDIDNNEYHTHNYDITISDIMSDEWVAVKLTITIEELET